MPTSLRQWHLDFTIKLPGLIIKFNYNKNYSDKELTLKGVSALIRYFWRYYLTKRSYIYASVEWIK